MDQFTVSAPESGVHDAVADTFAEVAREQGLPLGALTPQVRLFDLALDSLCLAVIVARLEARLGVDPFAADDLVLPASFGDFVALYVRAGAATPAGPARDAAPAAQAGA